MFKELAYYDGKIGTPDEVMIPFNDRSHFFGDGVYDATIGGNHVVYLLEDHLDRFYTSANYFDIKVPMEKEELGKLLTDLLKQVEGETHFVYWQVTRGIAPRDHAYSKDMVGKLWVWIKQSKAGDPKKELKLIVRPDTRFQHGNAKTLNLLPAVAGTQEATLWELMSVYCIAMALLQSVVTAMCRYSKTVCLSVILMISLFCAVLLRLI